MAEDFLDFEIRLQLAEEDISKLNKQLNQIAQKSAQAGTQIDDSFKDANKEIKLASNNMKEFKNMSTQLSGSITNAGDKFEQGFGIMTQSTQELREEISALSNSINNLTSTTDRFSQNTSSNFSNTTEAVSDTISATDSLHDALKKVATGIGVTFGVSQIQSFMSKVVAVRGEFQNLEIAMETILGSKEKSEKLMQQMIQTAATTPFELKDVASGAKQLLAYGESAENVNETLIRLGNIAAGLSQPLNDIVYLYGTTMTQGRLYTQDLNQFTGRGIPMIKELAKQFGVAESEVKKLVEEGKVGFPEVQKVIQSLTDEGGMFFNLMEKQSKSLQGQISNLQDSFDMMLNEIGQQTEGIISGAIGVVGKLVENYDKVGKAIIALIGTYGTYKAVLATVITLERLHKKLVMEAALQKKLAAASNIALSNAAAVSAAKHSIMATAVNNAKMAVKGLSASIKSLNPLAIGITASIVALGGAIYTYKRKTDSAKIATDLFNNSLEATDTLFQKRKQKSAELLATIQDETATELQKIQAYEELSTIMPKLTELYDLNALASMNMTETNKELNKVLDEMSVDDLTKKYNENIKEIKRLQDINQSMKENGTFNLFSFNINESEIKALRKANVELEKEIKKRQELSKTVITTSPEGKENIEEDIKEDIEKKKTNYLEQAQEKAARMEEDNYLKRLEYEAAIAKERDSNIEEYYRKIQELTDQEYEYKILAIEKEREEALKNAVLEDKNKINEAYDKQVTETQNEWQMKSDANTRAKDKEEYKTKLNL